MYRTLIHSAAIAALLALPAAAQTPAPTSASAPTSAELLQKGIFAQETSGNYDEAIQIYRQIVDSHPTDRTIAAQAQYRLGLTLLQKGDANTASQEIQRLAWDFPDYKDLLDAAKKASASAPQHKPMETLYVGQPNKNGGITFTETSPNSGTFTVSMPIAHPAVQHDAEFDFSQTAAVAGTVAQVQWLNPYSWLVVNPTSVTGALPSSAQVRISLASPADLTKAGFTKASLQPGDAVIVAGAPARDGTAILQATSVSANGNVLFSRPATPAQ